MPAAPSLRTGQRKKLLHYYRHHLDPSVRSRAHIILLLAHVWGEMVVRAAFVARISSVLRGLLSDARRCF
jgi:hypothetical protein